MVSVYLSGEKIQALCGGKSGDILTIRRAAELPLPEGCVLGGRILDREAVTSVLKRLAEDKAFAGAGVRIAVDSAALNVKRLTLPDLKSRRYMNKLIADSFPESTNAVYDYMELGSAPEGGISVIACRADSGFVEDYIECFGAAGFAVESISLCLCGVIRLAESCAMLKNASFAVAAADGSGVSCFVFAQGKYKGGGRERILSRRGTAEYAEDIRRLLSAQLRTEEGRISNLLMSGFSAEEQGRIRGLFAGTGVRCAELPNQPELLFAGGGRLSEFLFPAGALL